MSLGTDMNKPRDPMRPKRIGKQWVVLYFVGTYTMIKSKAFSDYQKAMEFYGEAVANTKGRERTQGEFSTTR